MLASSRLLRASGPATALLRFQAYSNWGPQDSLEVARKELLRQWPAQMNNGDMRDLFLSSIASGDRTSARFVLEKQWARVDTDFTVIEYRFYQGLLRGK